MKAFKVDGLVVSCTDAPKGDKDLIREKAVNMAYFSKKKEGYSHTCSEMEAVALAAERDGLDPERIGSIDARSCAKLARAIIKKKKGGGKTPAGPKASKAPTPASEPGSPVFADAGALAEANGAVELKEADVLRMKVAALEAKLAAQEANAVAPTPVQKQSPAEMKFSPAQERVGPDLCVVVKGLAADRRGFPYEMDKFVAICEDVEVLDKKLPRSALVEAKRSGSAVVEQTQSRRRRHVDGADRLRFDVRAETRAPPRAEPAFNALPRASTRSRSRARRSLRPICSHARARTRKSSLRFRVDCSTRCAKDRPSRRRAASGTRAASARSSSSPMWTCCTIAAATKAAAGKGAAATTTACAPVRESSKAKWRNRQFEKWSRAWRVKSDGSGRRLSTARLQNKSHHHHYSEMATPAWGSGLQAGATRSLLSIVPAFDALLPRHDLHRPPDCTHFCEPSSLMATLNGELLAAVRRFDRSKS